MTIKKGKFPSQPVPNPKGVHEVSTSSSQHHEEVKVVITLRKGKEVDNKVEMLMTKTTQVLPLKSENLSTKEKEDSSHKNTSLKLIFLRG